MEAQPASRAPSHARVNFRGARPQAVSHVGIDSFRAAREASFDITCTTFVKEVIRRVRCESA